MKTISIIVLFSVLCIPTARGKSPLDIDHEIYFKVTQLGYATPSVTYIRFADSEFVKFNPGYFWMDDIYLTIFDTNILGNDFFSSKDRNDHIYINTLYTSIVKIGGLWEWKNLRFYAELYTGILYTNYIRELQDVNSDLKVETVGAGGAGGGLRYKYGNWTLKTEISAASTKENEIVLFAAEIFYKFSEKWMMGFTFERAQRNVNLCEDTQDPQCQYIMNLNYGALYVGWKCYKEYWLLLGFGGSNLELGYKDDLIRKTLGGSLYISFK